MSIEDLASQKKYLEGGIKSDFEEGIFKILKNQNFFALIYGSFASWVHTKESDLDVVLSIPEVTEDLFNKIKDFLVELHRKYNLHLDNEVPYEKKLLVPYSVFWNAAGLSGLPFEKNNIEIPKIIKTKEFLASEQMRARLLFNILTVPTIWIGTDMEKLWEFKQKAERFLVLLWLHLLKKNFVQVDDFVWALLVWKDWRDGELFLGYKNNMRVVEYLKAIFVSSIEEFEKKWVIEPLQDGGFWIHQDLVLNMLKTEKASFIS